MNQSSDDPFELISDVRSLVLLSKAVEKRLAAEQERREQVAQQVVAMNDERKRYQQEIDGLKKKSSEQVNLLTQLKRSAEDKIASLRKELDLAQQRESELRSRMQGLIEAAKNSELKARESEAARLQEKELVAKTVAELSKTASRLAQSEKRMTSAIEHAQNAEERAEKLRAERENLIDTAKTAQARSDSSQKVLAEREQLLATKDQQIQQLRNQISQASQGFDSAQNELAQTRTQLHAARENLAKTESELTEQRRAYKALMNMTHSLKRELREIKQMGLTHHERTEITNGIDVVNLPDDVREAIDTRNIAVEEAQGLRSANENLKSELERIKKAYPVRDLIREKDRQIRDLEETLSTLPTENDGHRQVNDVLNTLKSQRDDLSGLLS